MIEALMIDVDGVLVDGRPEDARHWQTSLHEEFGFTRKALHEQFFAPHWEDIVLGRVGLMAPLTAALQRIAPSVSPDRFLSYWFAQDARLAIALLQALSTIRSAGRRVYLATNQEHLRAAYLMERLALGNHVDGIFYSAMLGASKPDPAFYERIEARIGLHGEALLLVDDSLQNIEAAQRAGWQTLHWTKGSSPADLHSLLDQSV